ncbi:Mucin-like domain,Histone acetyltransferases subunit 3 [Cinara cedri]|uniref:Mucin-like domain,Histone acetyltransferases subunit 3 n=1 Tax=Cinara cedri TaxID=506608 RepID=A0A5E4MHQ8_9HEMI|nr:Mucin-like domain,Histone acetyltransferases subunit 3 [Cinara cedri]
MEENPESKNQTQSKGVKSLFEEVSESREPRICQSSPDTSGTDVVKPLDQTLKSSHLNTSKTHVTIEERVLPLSNLELPSIKLDDDFLKILNRKDSENNQMTSNELDHVQWTLEKMLTDVIVSKNTIRDTLNSLTLMKSPLSPSENLEVIKRPIKKKDSAKTPLINKCYKPLNVSDYSDNEKQSAMEEESENKFWSSVDMYISPITKSDIDWLENSIKSYDQHDYLSEIPPLGEHYSNIWAEKELKPEHDQVACSNAQLVDQPSCSTMQTADQPSCSTTQTADQPSCSTTQTADQPSCSFTQTADQPSCSFTQTADQPSCSFTQTTEKYPLSQRVMPDVVDLLQKINRSVQKGSAFTPVYQRVTGALLEHLNISTDDSENNCSDDNGSLSQEINDDARTFYSEQNIEKQLYNLGLLNVNIENLPTSHTESDEILKEIENCDLVLAKLRKQNKKDLTTILKKCRIDYNQQNIRTQLKEVENNILNYRRRPNGHLTIEERNAQIYEENSNMHSLLNQRSNYLMELKSSKSILSDSEPEEINI